MKFPQNVRRFAARLLALWLLASPTGLVGAAIQPHLRESIGNTTVVGGALAAGQQAAITTGGDLVLLAAQSSTQRTINDYNQNGKKATTLKFDEQEIRQLLSTITVGGGGSSSGSSAGPLNISVGGNFSANTGERAPDGTLLSDRMTTAGVVKGDSRQQVSVTRTGVGADANRVNSQVLGDLASKGIRNGANDSFDPKAAVTGQAALQQYLQSGLVSIGNDPKLTSQLNTLLKPDGTTLTVKDASGNISLTLAGQAKVQEVFNTLKLSESFDTKKFADQGTAQIVTLVAAVVLTVCTAGAGAASLGAVAAAGMGAGATTAAMINAAIIAMSSTMIGQLAGGASFDEAFKQGLKAGATSAVMAGISIGINDFVNGGTPPTPTTIDSGPQVVQSGSNAATTGMKNLDTMMTAKYREQTALNAVAKGALAEAQGGKFKDGFTGSVLGGLAATGAGVVGDYTSTQPLANIVSHAVLGCAVAAAGKQDCGSGAIGGAASATLARLIDAGIGDADLSKTTKDAIIAGGSVAGSMAIASALGKDVLTAGNAAGNEVLNNYLYHYKERIIARDKNDNDKIIEVSEQDLRKLAAQNPEIFNQIVAGLGKQDGAPILLSEAVAKDMTASRVLDLNNPADRAQIAREGEMGYLNLTDQNTRIYVQTGMDNLPGDAVKSAQTLSALLKQPTGYLNNATDGLTGDVGEYLPNSLTKKDVLNEYTYRTLNEKGATLIITHSAGNEDARKALLAGALYGHEYNNLSFVSVGSPVGANALQATISQSGAQFLGQVNDWRDPVTYSKTAGIVSVGGFLGGIGYGAVQGCAGGVGAGWLGCALGGVAGGVAGGIPGVAGYLGLKNFHPFEQYIAKPQVQSIMYDWLKTNPPLTAGK